MRKLLLAIADGMPWSVMTQHPAYAGLAYRMRSVVRRDKEGKITFQGATPLDMFLRGADREQIVTEGFKCLKTA